MYLCVEVCFNLGRVGTQPPPLPQIPKLSLLHLKRLQDQLQSALDELDPGKTFLTMVSSLPGDVCVCVYECCVCIYLRELCACLELELQMTVSHQVGVGNQTQILLKSSQCS